MGRQNLFAYCFGYEKVSGYFKFAYLNKSMFGQSPRNLFRYNKGTFQGEIKNNGYTKT